MRGGDVALLPSGMRIEQRNAPNPAGWQAIPLFVVMCRNGTGGGPFIGKVGAGPVAAVRVN